MWHWMKKKKKLIKDQETHVKKTDEFRLNQKLKINVKYCYI